MILNSDNGATTPRQGNSIIHVVLHVQADDPRTVDVVPETSGTEGTWAAYSGGVGET